MLNYLLKKKIIDKNLILECIKKVNTWQMQNNSANEEQTLNMNKKEDTSCSKESKSLLTDDLKLNLLEAYPNSLDELDTFLSTKCTLNSSETKVTSKSCS
jgi:hypothetical protein